MMAHFRGPVKPAIRWDRSAAGCFGDDDQVNKTFDKGLMLLGLLARSERPKSISEMAGELSLTKSNVHRLLQTLSEHGYVERDEISGRYMPTLKTWEVGHDIWSRSRLRRATAPHTENLARRTNAMVQVTVIDGEDLLFFDQVGSPSLHPFRVFWPLGGRMRRWQILPGGNAVISSQICYLATLDDAGVEAALDLFQAELGADAEWRQALVARVREARFRGFATTEGEWNPEVRGAAAVFYESDGSPAGLLATTSPMEQAPEMNTEQIGMLARQTAEAISYELGYRKRGVA
jgi:DNA-binding IclR family transcriptional regulator